MTGPVTRTTNLTFLLARAEQARAEAEAATLDHVRERCLRSAGAWSALADQAQRSELLRIEDQERKAAAAASNANEDHIEEEKSESALRAIGRRPTSF